VDRKTARRYVAAAQAAGLTRDVGMGAVTDEVIGVVVDAVRPVRPNGHGVSWEALLAHEEQIRAWVTGGKGDGPGQEPLSIVKIEELLGRQGVRVPYRTLHRFAVQRCGFRARSTTVRVVDGEPGVECQVDFAQLGLLTDPETGKRRRVHALIFTAVVRRHMFVWLTYSQTLTAVIAGCEAAWESFGGAFKVLSDADAVNPTLSKGWLDYSQHVGFGTDPARVRSPQDKPRVERAVQYVRVIWSPAMGVHDVHEEGRLLSGVPRGCDYLPLSMTATECVRCECNACSYQVLGSSPGRCWAMTGADGSGRAVPGVPVIDRAFTEHGQGLRARPEGLVHLPRAARPGLARGHGRGCRRVCGLASAASGGSRWRGPGAADGGASLRRVECEPQARGVDLVL
jgi:hypothetical protein